MASVEATQGHKFDNIQVHGGKNILGNVLGNVYYTGTKEADDPLRRLAYAQEAPFNSFAKQNDPYCLDGTRTELLNEIGQWAGGHGSQSIFWLSGLAGTGKSTIARTVAYRSHKSDRLGASFFFSRGGGDVSHASKFVTSIAIQLAQYIPALSEHIRKAVTERFDISNDSLRDQWDELIIRPLSSLKSDDNLAPYLLVIDALDECEDSSHVEIIIQLLAGLCGLEKSQLRVLVTSRRETPIRHGFGRIDDIGHKDFLLQDITPSVVSHDISQFLTHNLERIREEDYLESDWPGDQAIASLVQNASGLFIWAATACRFVRDGPFADERLQTLLEGGAGADASTPEDHLNGIYITVLKASVNPGWSERERNMVFDLLRRVLGSIVVLFAPLSVESLAKLLAMPKPRVERMMKDLHAILDIPSQQRRPIRLHHPSFRDFLLDKGRCRDLNFWVEEKEAHRFLAERCVQLMSSSIKQDLHDCEARGVNPANMEMSSIAKHLPPELQCASVYWVQHFLKSGIECTDDNYIHMFLKTHFLHWLEALGWMQRLEDGTRAISSLLAVASNGKSPKLLAFLRDIKRFLFYNSSMIQQAPLQTYSSALIFAPSSSLVRQQFRDCVPQWIKRRPLVEENWSSLLQTLEPCQGPVSQVVFSPDGKTVASATGQSIIKLWDPKTGAIKNTISQYDRILNGIVFSHDSLTLAVSYLDGTAELWDAGRGTLQKSTTDLINPFQNFCMLAFSPDGKRLISVTKDDPKEVVRVWDIDAGAVHQVPKRESKSIHTEAEPITSAGGRRSMIAKQLRMQRIYDENTSSAVALSPNGKVLSLKPLQQSAELWDPETGSILQTFRQPPDDVEFVTAFCVSPDCNTIAVGAPDGTVFLYDAGADTPTRTLEGPKQPRALKFSPNGKLLVSVSQNNEMVMLWNAGSGELQQTFDGHLDGIEDVSFSPDSQILATGSNDNTVKLWDVSGETTQHMPTTALDGIRVVAFSPDGKLLASASVNGPIKMWDVKTGTVQRILEGSSPDNGTGAIAFSPDGTVLASAVFGGHVKVWDVKSGAELHKLDDAGQVYAVAISPDSRVLATATFKGTVGLWDVATGKIRRTLEGHASCCEGVAFAPNGKVLASASRDKTVKLWDVDTGAVLHTLEGHSERVWDVAFSPDGKTVASGSDDTEIRLWDVDSGESQTTLLAGRKVRKISFSKDGSFLETDRGAFAIPGLPHDERLSQERLASTVHLTQEWITRGIVNTLWIPQAYSSNSHSATPIPAATYGNLVALGHQSGRVAFLELSPTR